MTDEQAFDEELIAKIIAAAESRGVKVKPGNRWGFGANASAGVTYKPCDPQGPVCAIGAGLLYADVVATGYGNWCEDFATTHGVSRDYARGVSAGFEEFDAAGYDERGVAVGEAVRAAFEDVP